jgi:hypothetical protein
MLAAGCFFNNLFFQFFDIQKLANLLQKLVKLVEFKLLKEKKKIQNFPFPKPLQIFCQKSHKICQGKNHWSAQGTEIQSPI